VVGYTQVRGHRAEIDAVSQNRNRYMNVRWREGEVGYVVTGDIRRGATLRQAQEVLVRIAQSLR
jgi:anti-sigma factor RsiW